MTVNLPCGLDNSGSPRKHTYDAHFREGASREVSLSREDPLCMWTLLPHGLEGKGGQRSPRIHLFLPPGCSYNRSRPWSCLPDGPCLFKPRVKTNLPQFAFVWYFVKATRKVITLRVGVRKLKTEAAAIHSGEHEKERQPRGLTWSWPDSPVKS